MRRITGSYDEAFAEIWDRLRKLETTAPTGFTSITRGSLRVASEDGLVVQGSALVTGMFRAVGQIMLEALGILTIKGLALLFGSLRVKGGGDITVEDGGDMVVDGGQILINGGTPIRLGTNGSGIASITLGASEIRGADNGIVLDPGVGAAIVTGSSGVRIFLLPDAPAGAQPNLHINDLGYLSVIR